MVNIPNSDVRTTLTYVRNTTPSLGVRPVQVGFPVDKVEINGVFSQHFYFSAVRIASPTHHKNSPVPDIAQS